MRRRGRVAVRHERERDRVGRALRGARDRVVRAVKTFEPLLDRHRLDRLDVGQRAYLECLHEGFSLTHHAALPIVATGSALDGREAAASVSVPR